jgi:hypothetical protein
MGMERLDLVGHMEAPISKVLTAVIHFVDGWVVVDHCLRVEEYSALGVHSQVEEDPKSWARVGELPGCSHHL